MRDEFPEPKEWNRQSETYSFLQEKIEQLYAQIEKLERENARLRVRQNPPAVEKLQDENEELQGELAELKNDIWQEDA